MSQTKHNPCEHGVGVSVVRGCIICDVEIVAGKRENDGSWIEDAELKMEGFVVAHTILDHSCWRCCIPFMSCREQRERSNRLEQISKRLGEINGD